MSKPAALLSTKQMVPPASMHWVPRPRLLQILDQGLHPSVHLTLVSAPAGYGKTSLLSEWVRGRPEPAAWITLDEGDNDPARFLSYFIAALQSINDDLGRGALSTFQFPEHPGLAYLFTVLINKLADVDQEVILVLDDFHLVTAAPIHEALQFFIDHLPPNIHMVIATRADPPFPLGRMRGKGTLCEVREAHLRFTPQEVTPLLNSFADSDLLPEQIAGLTARTEGWAAGLQLVALSLRSHPDADAFIRAFSGSHAYILDYLSQEVLSGLPAALRSFLLSTSILNRLSGPLCEAVSGQLDAKAKLAQIRDANLFLTPLDDQQEWYRYHHLFAESLLQRLMSTQPERIPDLHRRASTWFWNKDMAGDAIRHALLAGEYALAAEQIEATAEATLMRSEVGTLLHWIDSLPKQVREIHPLLQSYYAAAKLLSVQTPADSAPTAVQGRVGTASEADAVQALQAMLQGDVSTASEVSAYLLEKLPAESLFLRSVAAWNLAITRVLAGDIPRSIDGLEKAVGIAEQAGNQMIAVVARCHLAEILIVGGRVTDAGAMYERALALAVDESGQDLPITGMARIGLAEFHRERNNLETAEGFLREGRDLIADWAAIGVIEGMLAQARLWQSQGDMAAAQEELSDARRMAAAFQATEWDDFLVATQQALTWMIQGDLASAARWGQDLERETKPVERLDAPLDASIPTYHLLEPAWIALARLRILQDKHQEAQGLVDKLLSRSSLLGRWGSVLQLNILQALSLARQSRPEAALEALDQALRLAVQGGYLRMFLEEGDWMADLLRQAMQAGMRPQYVSRLLNALKQEKDPASRLHARIDELSKREMQVLRLLSTHLSSAEIGEELSISPNTVRTHIKNIYSKLGVHRRSQAIDRAQDLDLL